MKKVFSIIALIAVSMLLATSCSNKCKCCSEGKCPCEQMGDKFPGKPGEGGPADGQHSEGNHGPHQGHPGCNGKGLHHTNPEMAKKIGKWMLFDSLSVDEQKELIAERKAAIDSMDAVRNAKKAEIEEKWASFDNLSIEEQKQLLDLKNRMPFMPVHKKGMHPGCKGNHGDHHHGNK